MKYTYYWSTDSQKFPMKVIPVIADGYREVTSMEHLREKQCCSIPYDMLQKYKTYTVYNPVPRCCRQEDIDYDDKFAEKHPEWTRRYEVVSDKPISMTEFFKLIKYDYKTKKFDGLTMKQVINKYMKEHE